MGQAYIGSYHNVPAEHAEHQLRDLAGRHKMRVPYTGEQLTTVVRYMAGNPLR